jgi:hypothetical protein
MRRMVCCFFLLSTVETSAEGLERLPEPISVNGGTEIARVEGVGAQIYACSKNAKGGLEWTFREPIATLVDKGKTVGRHFAGPIWEFADGSHVAGKLAAKFPGQSKRDIPWLKLSVVQQATTGPAAGATWILRLDTKGGAFEGSCLIEGDLHAEPYAAIYVFGR